MKKLLAIASLLFFITLGGCKKMVDEVPLSDGTLELFFRNRFDAEAAMAGMYGAFHTTMIGESQFNNRITYWGDARADNMMNNIPNNISNEIHFNSLSPNNTYS